MEDQETAAAPNVDPDAVMTGEDVDKALDISRAEAAANAADAEESRSSDRGAGA